MKNYWPYYIAAIVCFVIAFVAPMIFTKLDYHHFNSKTGVIGDTIGGLTSPFLNIAGSILVFAALKAQIDANKAVQDQFIKQQTENNKHDLEQKLFRLFDLHISIVHSYSINKQKIFIDFHTGLYREIQYGSIEFDSKIQEIHNISPNTLVGIGVFDETIELFDWAMFDGANHYYKKDVNPNEILESSYEFFYEPLKGLFYRYFNNCFYIIRTINESKYHDDSEKRDLMNMYLNQFTYNELKWLFWTSFKEEYVPYVNLLDRYSFFSSFTNEDLTMKGMMDFPERYSHLREILSPEEND
jgi:hypothetical protein